MRFSRFAVYHLPAGALGAWGAEWLGWDARHGLALPVPQGIAGLDIAALIATPRRYGFHATLKAPFRLAEGASIDDLVRRLEQIAAGHAPIDLKLGMSRDWGFLALRPVAPPPELATLESALVRDLDPFRAPLTAAEIARRRPPHLPKTAQSHLRRWGYPFVLDLFHYHLTLTGPLAGPVAGRDLDRISDVLARDLQPLISQPIPLDAVTLVGETAEGLFHRVADFPLTASSAT